MSTQPQLMSRSRGKTLEYGYLFPDELATIYLNAERKGARYGYAHAAQLTSEGWSGCRGPLAVTN
jgi:predicted ATPase